MSLRIAWLEVPHPNLGYYDALRDELSLRRGHNLSHTHRHVGQLLHQGTYDAAILGFGWFPMERPPLPRLPEFEHATCAKTVEPKSVASSQCWCGKIPLVVMLNKEYVLLREKLAWLQAHCVSVALTVHHDAELYEAETGVPFRRIWFGVDAMRFADAQPSTSAGPSSSTSSGRTPGLTPGTTTAVVDASTSGYGTAIGSVPSSTARSYSYDLGFTGVVRADQTANWRFRIWKQAWPALSARGLRLFSGPKRGVHIGVTHMAMNSSEYVQSMRASKLWLSTTGPADLVGTRYFEVMATGTTLCVCNRMPPDKPNVYASLGIKEGRHVAMFDSIAEFVEVVTNYSTRPEYEAKRMAMVQRAQAIALKKYTWLHVAERVEDAIREAMSYQAMSGGGGGTRHHALRRSKSSMHARNGTVGGHALNQATTTGWTASAEEAVQQRGAAGLLQRNGSRSVGNKEHNLQAREQQLENELRRVRGELLLLDAK